MIQGSLFDDEYDQGRPLANRVRPQNLEEFVGQKHLLEPGKVLREMIENDQVSSMIFWGPPGVGKTTLAKIIANQTQSKFIDFSAVTSGIKDIRSVMKEAEGNRQLGEKTLLFIDEIHRFNKAQQDAFLPYVEKGSIILIGATTENPSFEVNSALLSRSKVFVLHPLNHADILELLQKALANPKGFNNQSIEIEDGVLSAIAEYCDGDARVALNTLEMAVLHGKKLDGAIVVNKNDLVQMLNRKSLLYDKNGEEHYNIISALHKSMRNSDVNAAIYWLSRMLESGEDPLFIARRLVRFASEDIGLADNRALEISVAVFQACQFIGMPECDVHLTQAVIYLTLAPKSNAAYLAYRAAKKDALHSANEPVPLQLRNAPTKLMKKLNYGKGYKYAHDTQEKLTMMQTMPDSLIGREYYHPTIQGSEIKFKQRMEEISAWYASHKET
ncbi:replication-associated recombination protein A [Paenibacillus polymyxa]|uniref:replication-associated recombination protein A n=1 Tax=Paenibacillus polymyxa TaxID=1406 RepID=UPI0005CE35FA|nr:replication-associated recombination protein A [Paenibacillus polymyxa]KJD39119.1 ATPase AAA [Paenibacillus polymyxa]MBE3649844.1 replication-associated recombination protein A [Paenibacillus polymyxa]PNQ85346.1 replication-associated recombination protein A [Paenibacillus polymyxa]UNL95275.1 replication-associated recombination protein A [Paenibacillus polymyxa]